MVCDVSRLPRSLCGPAAISVQHPRTEKKAMLDPRAAPPNEIISDQARRATQRPRPSLMAATSDATRTPPLLGVVVVLMVLLAHHTQRRGSLPNRPHQPKPVAGYNSIQMHTPRRRCHPHPHAHRHLQEHPRAHHTVANVHMDNLKSGQHQPVTHWCHVLPLAAFTVFFFGAFSIE